uniref:Putative c-myc-binding protein isoform x1 n=1 Tax=Tabanus bromius TaxID=304241 RepID=A0A0K8TQJ3_TABBR
MSFKPIDVKRDEFRKYLERTGALDAISKVFIKLFECPDRPENAIEFIRVNIGDAIQETETVEYLKKELEECRNEIVELNKTIAILEKDKKSSNNSVAAATQSGVSDHNTQLKAENTDENADMEVKTGVNEKSDAHKSKSTSADITSESTETDAANESEPKKTNEGN